jgi:prophage tail gpP-like protein
LSFSETSYADLTQQALAAAGLDFVLETSNEANRLAITGSKRARELVNPLAQYSADTQAPKASSGVVYNQLRATSANSWWQFLLQQYRRAGLFLWEGTDGQLILASPNIEQETLCTLHRTSSAVPNISGHSFSFDVSGRRSECRVYGQATRLAKSGVSKVAARYVDDEMVALLNPDPSKRDDGGERKLPWVVEDDHVKTYEQALALAKREIAEMRRASYQLSYTTPGHLVEGKGERVVVGPDCVLQIEDDDLGIRGHAWTERVEWIGNKDSSSTEIKLLRPSDVYFLAEPETSAEMDARAKAAMRGRLSIKMQEVPE